jgi:formate dehydrogenase subunit delta
MSALDSHAGDAASGQAGHPDQGAHADHAYHRGRVRDNLVRMVNRIGHFYESYPDRDEAIDGVAVHIRKFWEPRMRRQLYAHLDGAAAGEGLSELVRAAVLARRAELEPKA